MILQFQVSSFPPFARLAFRPWRDSPLAIGGKFWRLGGFRVCMMCAIGLLTNDCLSQEVVWPLKYNYDLIGEVAPNRAGHRAPNDTLPFVDDFSHRSKFPDPDKWTDNSAYINATYPINPPTIGVATFDGLRANGTPQASGSSYGSSDTLTCVPLKLAAYTAGDNVYLSFFYEASGNGNDPESDDSLVVEFLGSDSTWHRIWGVSVDSIAFDSFYRHDIHLDDTLFLFDGFRFRFRNYADKRGNNDHWHVDYVRLDDNRFAGDPLNDVAFTEPGVSLLDDYESMPLHQFQDFETDELRDTLVIHMRNNFTVNKNVNYRYVAEEDCGQTQFHSQNIGVIGNFVSLSADELSEPNFKPEITALSSTAACDSLTITTRYIQDSIATDVNYGNDTLIHNQYFGNYFAYDDGTAEQAYGVIGTGAMVAYKFHANKPDTLRAVQIHFAHIDDDPSGFLFSLIVWDSIDLSAGANGDHVLYRQDFMTPEFIDTLNGFHTYFLDTVKIVSGNFWVGWQQGQPNNLGIGYDVNHDAGQRTFYNTFGNWLVSQFHGAMMIRPALGNEFFVGVDEPVSSTDDLHVFPNPASDQLNIETTQRVAEIVVSDLLGRVVMRKEFHLKSSIFNTRYSLDVSFLRDGTYFIQVLDDNHSRIGSSRFVKLSR